MKHSIKGLFVILAIVMSFIAVQSVSADVFIVEGEITLKDERPNTVGVETADGPIYVNGVRYKYLEKHFDISLDVGDQVAFTVYEYLCDDGELLNKACKLLKPDTDPEVPDNWIDLRTCIKIYQQWKKRMSGAISKGLPAEKAILLLGSGLIGFADFRKKLKK